MRVAIFPAVALALMRVMLAPYASSAGGVSAAGEALQMLPPSVARFWLAMVPVQEADSMSSGRSAAISALRRMSVKVAPEPMWIASCSDGRC